MAKKILKSKILWIIVILAVAGIGYGIYQGGKSGNKIQISSEKVKRGEIVQTVSATGAVQSAKEIELNFNTQGKLVFIGVKEGDKVKAGQILARLDAAGVEAQVRQLRAEVSAANAELSRVRSGASTQDLDLTNARVAKAVSDINSLTVEHGSQSASLLENTINNFSNSIFSAQTALDKINNYFIKEGNTKNLQFTDLPMRQYVENNYWQQEKELARIKALATTAKNSGDYPQIVAAADGIRDFLLSLNEYVDKSFILSESIITNSSFPQTLKDSIKADMAAQQAALSAVLNSLQLAKTNLINSSSSYQSQLDALNKNLAIARAELGLKQAGPRDFEIASAQARVSQAQASLEGAISLLNNYQIISPIEGEITRVEYHVGEQTQVGKSIIKMIAKEQYEIKVDIPESDITKIKIGDRVSVELDAFGSDHLFSGTVSFIDPAQTVIQDVTYYKATVSFDKDSWSEQIKPGMTANVTIATSKKDDILYIPQRAVKVREGTMDKPGDKYVEVLTGTDQFIEKTITTGLRADGGLVEVLTGLSEGEDVITFRK